MSTNAYHPPAFDEVREADGSGFGEVLELNVFGTVDHHGIEMLMADVSEHRDEYGFRFDDAFPHGFEIDYAIRGTVHPECDDPDGPDCWHDYSEYVYRSLVPGTPQELSEDEQLVTRLYEPHTGLGQRCAYHHDRWATTRASTKYWWTLHPDETPFDAKGDLWLCNECHRELDQRQQTQIRLRVQEVQRRRDVGVPERLIYA